MACRTLTEPSRILNRGSFPQARAPNRTAGQHCCPAISAICRLFADLDHKSGQQEAYCEELARSGFWHRGYEEFLAGLPGISCEDLPVRHAEASADR